MWVVYEQDNDMALLRGILAIFLFPGNLAIKALGITVEQDGGIIRSFINMVFWGLLAFLIALPYMLP